jgi:hypothetical protein
VRLIETTAYPQVCVCVRVCVRVCICTFTRIV